MSVFIPAPPFVSNVENDVLPELEEDLIYVDVRPLLLHSELLNVDFVGFEIFLVDAVG